MVASGVIGGPDMVVFAAHSVDHNILTIDGRENFHGVGLIPATTPETHSAHPI